MDATEARQGGGPWGGENLSMEEGGSSVAAPAPRNWGPEEERALRLWIALARCYLSFSRAVSAKISAYGLTPPQFGVLEALHHLGPLTLGALAGKLLVTGGNITYVMDRLEGQGLVLRQRSEKDGRVILAHLTPEGRRLMAQVFPSHAEFIEELVSSLTPKEQTQMQSLLKRLGKAVASRTS